ncbi:MAG: dockerin type I repeat-containing protein [Ruminococcus sp.]|nr:dockerin type I repeat-containing protein [Ruminococcus sp.]
MKKTISALLAAAVVLPTLAVGGFSAAAEEAYRYGDANLDRVINVEDATLMQRASVGLETLSGNRAKISDVNGDGRVSILDVTCVQKYLAEQTAGCEKTGEPYTMTTEHRLLKTVKSYQTISGFKEREPIATVTLTYKNVYPNVIDCTYADEDMGSTTTFFQYTFEEGLPKTCTMTNDYTDEVTTMTYRNGSLYDFHREGNGGFCDTYYQYANGNDYFTSLFRVEDAAPDPSGNIAHMEETDSVQVTLDENGLLQKTVNSGYYANWDDHNPKRWLRFNGTYTAVYDSDGIAKLMTAVYRNGPDSTVFSVEVTRQDGVITEATVTSGAISTTYEFEYTDIEISPQRYSNMMNYFIIGSSSNFYNNNWF